MTAAAKLRDLLRTRPGMPDTQELVRWWRSSADLVTEVIDELDAAWNATGIAGSVRGGTLGVRLSEMIAKFKSERDLAERRLASAVDAHVEATSRHNEERQRFTAEREAALVEIQVLQRHRPDAVEMARLDGEVGRLQAELDNITRPHPTSWLDCDDCRALSKSGAKPPRCEAFIAKEGSCR